MRATPILTNFTSGEVSPLFEGRVDVSKYYNSAKKLENCLILPVGGVTSCPGTYFVAEVKDSAKQVRLIPFQFNVEQAYILEFGDQYIRFYMDEGQIQSAGSPYEISSVYLENELFNIQYAQDADIMYLVNENHPVYKLSRTGHTAWTITEVEFTWGPFLDDNTDTSLTITPSGTTGTITLTASSALFDAKHVGALWRIQTGYVKITGYTSSTSVTADVKETLPGTTATDDWAEGAWSAYRGYPQCVTFFGGRLFFANTKNNPQTIWASVVDDYENMKTGSDDADALKYTIATEQVNAIKWLSAGKILAVGTEGGIFSLSSGSTSTPLTPSNVVVLRESNLGAENILPKMIGNFTYFVQRGKSRLRELAYNLDIDSYQASDMTKLADHISGTGFKEAAYQQVPYNYLWVIRDDGQLAIFLRDVHEEIMGWSRRVTDGYYESVATIPYNNKDQVWVVVKRNIKGVDVRYIEYFKDMLETTQEDCFYVDCGLTYDGTATTTISGLNHLEGAEVAILADGAVHPNKTVVSGSITLDWAAEKVQVGLPYTVEIQTSRVEVGTQFGTAQGRRKRFSQVYVRFYNTLGAKIGTPSKQDTLLFRTPSDLMGDPPSLYTGDKYVQFPGGFDTDGYVVIKQEQPLPLTVLAIMPIFEVHSG